MDPFPKIILSLAIASLVHFSAWANDNNPDVPLPDSINDSPVTGDFVPMNNFNPGRPPIPTPKKLPETAFPSKSPGSSSAPNNQPPPGPPPVKQEPFLVPPMDLHDVALLDGNATRQNVLATIKNIFNKWDTAEQSTERTIVPSALNLNSDPSAKEMIKRMQAIFAQVPEIVFIPTMYNLLIDCDFQTHYQIHSGPMGAIKEVKGDNIQSFLLSKLLADHLTVEMIPEVQHFIQQKPDTAFMLPCNSDIFESPKATEMILGLIKTQSSKTFTRSTKLSIILRALRSDNPTMRSDLPDIFANLAGDAYAAEAALRPLLLTTKEYRISQTTAMSLSSFLPHVTDPVTRSQVNFDLSLFGQLQAINAVRLEALDPSNPAQDAIKHRIQDMCASFDIPYHDNPEILAKLQWDSKNAKWFLPQ